MKRQRESQKPTDSYRDSKELTVGKHVRSQSHSIPRRFPDGKTPGCEKPPVTTPVAAGRERHSRGAGQTNAWHATQNLWGCMHDTSLN